MPGRNSTPARGAPPDTSCGAESAASDGNDPLTTPAGRSRHSRNGRPLARTPHWPCAAKSSTPNMMNGGSWGDAGMRRGSPIGLARADGDVEVVTGCNCGVSVLRGTTATLARCRAGAGLPPEPIDERRPAFHPRSTSSQPAACSSGRERQDKPRPILAQGLQEGRREDRKGAGLAPDRRELPPPANAAGAPFWGERRNAALRPLCGRHEPPG
jgi:hypothetical protein